MQRQAAEIERKIKSSVPLTRDEQILLLTNLLIVSSTRRDQGYASE